MKIACLAPEIPALSATFVYNEILALEELGNDVIPVSVHHPHSEATDPALTALKKKVRFLYSVSKSRVLQAHFKLMLTQPRRYLKSAVMLLSDVVKAGLLSRLAAGLLYRFFYAGELARILNDEQVEHLHVHFAHIPTDIAMYASSMSGTGFSVTAHANDIFQRGWLLPEKVARSRFFATISEFNRRYLVEQKQVSQEKLTIVRCGVDTRLFSTRPEKPLHAPIKIGVVGRLVEKKGVDTLIAAAAILKSKNINVELEIAGSGPLEQELKTQVRNADMENSVSFIGALPHTEVADFISALDVFVLPCKQDRDGDMDGIPVVLMEAMMSGIPVISTQLSGIPELVIDEETGMCIEPNNPAQLAQAIIELSENSTNRKAMRARAEQKVQEEFSLNVNVNRLNAYFHDALVTQS